MECLRCKEELKFMYVLSVNIQNLYIQEHLIGLIRKSLNLWKYNT